MPENKDKILWLDPGGDGTYVSGLSRLFGSEYRINANLDNGLVVYAGTHVAAEVTLDDKNKIKAITVGELPDDMVRDDFFRAVEKFMGLEVRCHESSVDP